VFILVFRWNAKRHSQQWLSISLKALAVSVALFFSYDRLNSMWTCSYDGKAIVIGSDSALTDHGKSFRDTHPEFVTHDKWVMAHAGNVEEIWTKQSVDTHCLMLSILYVFIPPAVALFVISVSQAIDCAMRKHVE
jgi:hypothetical protein